MQMNPTETAILLVGYQNDFFRADGLLHGAVGEEIQNRNVLPNTLRLLERALFSGVTVVSTPIAFTDDYRELENPVGILKTIKELGAFRKSSPGSRTVDALQKFSDRIVELPGKQGLCSFSNTGSGQSVAGTRHQKRGDRRRGHQRLHRFHRSSGGGQGIQRQHPVRLHRGTIGV